MLESNELVLIRRSSDALVHHECVNWAVDRMKQVCGQKGIAIQDIAEEADELHPPDKGVVLRISGPGYVQSDVQKATAPEEALLSAEAESFVLYRGEQVIYAAGGDERGLMYALLELADIILHAEDPVYELQRITTHAERPASPVRSINRLFVSEAEDKAWFYDQTFWREYLTELATHRFNRLHLALGMGYDYGHDPGVKDNYFCFAYPFFVDLPAYGISVQGLPAGEAKRNLEMLQYIGSECKRRGIHFQLGLWNHAYDLSESPNANYLIQGMTPENHAPYCRDALRQLLQACPDIGGVTIRTHYEGGIPEPAEAFWQEVFSGMAACGRRVELDLHAKGLDVDRLQAALDHNLPVVVSPKYWAEHMGLPYHQAAIRMQELPVEHTDRGDLMSITATYRRFTRYGYGDFLKEDRSYGILFRIWPGTQRVLLWGDPEMAAGYGRQGTFCGSLGVELCEPLSFKGRKGSGSSGGRELYAEPSLQLSGEEWKKYLYTYRVWGRLLYNPDADPSTWQRYLRAEFGEGANACEQALAYASRILPLFTVAHLPSAANNVYWPEMYANMPIVAQTGPTPYDFDTPAPKTFGAVSPADPALFYSINEYADALLKGNLSGKLSPLEVADRLERLAGQAEAFMHQAAATVIDPDAPAYRRWSVDVELLSGLGRFFAAKLRTGTAYALFERTGEPVHLDQAINSYRSAKDAWMQAASLTRGIYKEDITFGFVPYMRGHWAARLSAIEADLAAMELQRNDASAAGRWEEIALSSAENALLRQDASAARPKLVHTPPSGFVPGEGLYLEAVLEGASEHATIILHYRHVNQAAAYQQAEAQRSGNGFAFTLPGTYTDSPYPLLYFYEISDGQGQVWQAPGFDEALSNQPYYVLSRIALR